jgi:hypothetical protein
MYRLYALILDGRRAVRADVPVGEPGEFLRSALQTVRPPTPESKTPIGRRTPSFTRAPWIESGNWPTRARARFHQTL